LKIRCSSLPRIMACPASIETPEMEIDTSGDDAALGRAIHEVMAVISMTGIAPDSLENTAEKHGVSIRDLERGVGKARALWSKIAPSIEVGAVEKKMLAKFSSFDLTGHADLVGWSDGAPLILDWKTGHRESAAYYQLAGYAVLADPDIEFAGPVKIVLAHTELGIIDVREIAPDERRQLIFDVTKIINAEKRSYSPGPSCEYCPRKSECPARNEMLQSAGRDIAALAGAPETAITPARLAALWPQRCALKKAVDEYDRQCRLAVAEHGAISGPDGMELATEAGSRSTVEYRPEILEKYVADVGDVRATVSRRDIEDAVKSAAPPRQKGKMVAACFQELDAAGAIIRSEFEKLVWRKKHDGN